MDFIEYESFTVGESNTIDVIEESLPEPVARLNLNVLSSFDDQDKFKDKFKDFNLSDLLGDSLSLENDKELNLHEKMAKYAALSMETLNISNTVEGNPSSALPSYIPDNNKQSLDISKLVSQQKSHNMETTNMILNKKLSKILNDYSFSNYQNTFHLRKSLHSLEENKITLSLDEDELTNPGYMGTLARKTLKRDVETELLKEHLTILEEFRPIVRRIKRLSTSIESIQVIGSSVLDDSETSDSKSEVSMLNKIDKLHIEIDNLKLKEQILIKFKEQYTLTQIEEDLVTNGYIDDSFFKTINKIMKIKERAMYLLGLPKTNAGNVLIIEVNELLERSNRKLFNYLVDFLYSFESNSDNATDKLFSPDESNLIVFQRSLIYLSNDLEYFNEFLKRVTTLRSKTVLDQFLSQFDFNSKTANPIILSTHDPLRYIGDILANVYTLIANEADFVRSLFDFQESHMENTPTSILQQNEEFLKGLDSKLLNDIIQSLANTCRIRISQIVKFEDNPIINFEIIQLLNLYQMMFERKDIKSGSLLINNLKSLSRGSQEKLENYYCTFIKNIDNTEYLVTQDLLPPEWLSNYLGQLAELFDKYEQHSAEAINDENCLINLKFLEKTVKDPIENILQKQLKVAFPLAKKEEQERSLYYTVQINCWDLIKSRLQPFSRIIFSVENSGAEVFNWISDKYDESVNQMLELQNKILFDKTGLGLYSNLLNMIFPVTSIQDELDYEMYFSLSDNSLMDLDIIKTKVHEKLNEYAPIALTDLQGNLLFKLSSPIIADNICETCFSNLSRFYITFRKVLTHLYPDDNEKILEILNFSEEEFNTLIGM